MIFFSQLEKNIDTSSIQIAIKFNDMNLYYNYGGYIYRIDADTGEFENSNYETFLVQKKNSQMSEKKNNDFYFLVWCYKWVTPPPLMNLPNLVSYLNPDMLFLKP